MSDNQMNTFKNVTTHGNRAITCEGESMQSVFILLGSIQTVVWPMFSIQYIAWHFWTLSFDSYYNVYCVSEPNLIKPTLSFYFINYFFFFFW